MTYRGAPRFKVSELEGFARTVSGGGAVPGLTLTVVDRAYCSQVMRMWRTEEGHSRELWLKRAQMRTAADELAAELNERHG